MSYIQPGPFIVKKPIYSPSFKTPVLTPGKTFVLGYTDEKEGIFKTQGRSVIIFDDFTTASRLVDFDFKVKSSAMKILITDESKNDINYLYYMLKTIKINSDTHKRFWISEYAPYVVFLPDKENQTKIAENIEMLFLLIDKLSVC